MKENIIKLILFILGIIIIMDSLDYYVNYINNNENEEFIDNYYYWNWNKPNIIKQINYNKNSKKCKNCSYSMSCDYTDDAQPFCYKSSDVPSIKYDKKESKYISSQNSI